MKWQPYPKYKPSGVEWLGEIPEHWGIKRLKTAAIVEMGQSPSSDECNFDGDGIPFLQGNSEFGQKHPIPKLYCPTAKKFAKKGDYLLSVRAPVGALNIADQDYGIGRGLCAIRMNEADLRKYFGFYLLQVVRIGLHAVATGSTYDAVSINQVACITCPLPSLLEQDLITAFLNRETGRINTLIEKKQRQIELLQEKRSTLISHAVTKGLEPSTPLKNSDIEWMGQIPTHWKLIKLKHITNSIQTGPFGSQLHAGEYVEDGIPAVNPSNLQNGAIIPDWRCCVDEEIFARLKRHRLNEGDIVFARRGEMGRCALVTREEDGWLCGTGSIRIKLNKKDAYPPFVYQVLSTPGVRDWLFLESVGSTMDNLNTEIMSRIPILLPPLDEQIYIVGETEKHLQQIDNLKTKVQESIDRLKEYRVALISAAVTGRIDVREEAA